jgi:hypothetical protein
MALREFGDVDGGRWEVWDTVPSTPEGNFADTAVGRLLGGRPDDGDPHKPVATRFTPGRESGWLTFASGSERRRLSPIPSGWEGCSDEELRRHLARADRVANAPPRIGRESRRG